MNRRNVLSLLLAAALGLGLCACGPGGGEGEDNRDPLEAYAEVPVVYEKIDAEHEDASLSLWFDHAFAKTTRDVTTSSGRETYKLYMGRNEREDCQFFLSAVSDRTVSLSVTDFTRDDGAAVPAQLYYEVSFAMPYQGETREVPDALPPVQGEQRFELTAGTSAGFVLQAETTAETPGGTYTAVLDVRDAEGRQVKTAKVFLQVWNFTLSDATDCRTAMWIDRNQLSGMDYKEVYDFLLENRVNAYDLPYALADERVDAYLDNPRVNSFNILGFKFNRESGKSEAQIKSAMQAAYAKLSVKADWNRKGYFYLVDEPTPSKPNKYGDIQMYGEWLEENYPGYRQLSPFFIDAMADAEQDWIEVLRPYINIWVPKTYAYTTLRQYGQILGGRHLYQEGFEGEIEAKFGSYPSRIDRLVREDGDEAWWYVTSQPTDPYITLNTTEPGVAYRVLFWQQKMNNVKGFLYWSVNFFSGDGWNNREYEWQPGEKTYGNGQLIYPGAKVGLAGPVGSLRLEAVRDGIEDYQLFSMLEKKIGTDKVKEFINRITTHVAVWNDNNDTFAGERVRLGNYLEALLAQG